MSASLINKNPGGGNKCYAQVEFPCNCGDRLKCLYGSHTTEGSEGGGGGEG